jgi:hypothetical protein
MSDTPETDKNVSVGLENADRECVPVDFCRKLERERDEARRERNEAREALKAFQPLTHHDCSFYKDIMGNCIICKNKETK